MAKRKRLTPVQAPASAPEVKSAPMRAAPIAQVASEAATTHALQELSDLVTAARDEGRLIQPLPLSMIEAGHLVRDRLLDDSDDEMEALVASLRARGQQTPLDVVALENGRYGLISGLRRLTALKRLGQDTALARVIAPDSASDAYVAMIEENEIRASLSLYERARIVAKAVEAGVYPDTRDALLTLYASTPRAKRSKIKSVITVVEALDGALRFPTALSERTCLDLARALEEDAGFGEVLRSRLTANLAEDAAAELALLTAPKAAEPVKFEQNPPDLEKNDVQGDKNHPEIGEKPDASQTMQDEKMHGKRENENPPHRPLDAFTPVPGIYVQSQTNSEGHTRPIFTGPRVDDGLRHKISRWLRAEEE